MIEIKVPTVGESISEVTLAEWKIADGDYVKRDQIICELESEKATFELNAEQAGTVTFVANEGDDLNIGDVVCKIDESATAPEGAEEKEDKSSDTTAADKKQDATNGAEEKKDSTDHAKEKKSDDKAAHEEVKPGEIEFKKPPSHVKATPVAAQIISENKVDSDKITGTGPEGRITKSDVLEYLAGPIDSSKKAFTREESREKMSKLRRTISRRLVEAKNTTAMLTTFNEVDMGAIMDMRKQYKVEFAEKHGVGLGFMSFFTRAVAIALQEWPSVNAYIDGEEIIYHDYVDISIAVSAPKGLVVPIIRNAESLTMDGIEKEVKRLATKARDNKLELEEMQGGTFTITNGGVFGSLLSTPILNLPQSAILGMHKIEDRPMAINGEVVIRPMMYLALSYDHRIIDGRESVGFLVRVKELLEDPTKMIAAKPVNQVLLDL